MTSKELAILAKCAKSGRMKNRYLAISHFLDGKSRADIARYLKVARGSVNSWVRNYLDHGIKGLDEGKHTGRPAQLTTKQLDEVATFISDNSALEKGGRLQAKDIQAFISDRFEVTYQISNVYRLLHQLNFSWITSRSRHPKQDEGVQSLFKNLPIGNDP